MIMPEVLGSDDSCIPRASAALCPAARLERTDSKSSEQKEE
jgi:hypothetical protein